MSGSTLTTQPDTGGIAPSPAGRSARALVWLFDRLPFGLIEFAVRLAVWLASWSERVSTTVEDNLRVAFGRSGPNLAGECLGRMADNLVATLRSTRSGAPPIRVLNPDVYERIVRGGAWLGVTGHFGPFDLLGALAVQQSTCLRVVVRPPNNRLVGGVLDIFRRRLGTDWIDKKNVMREAIQTLERGCGVGMLADHNAGFQGQFVPFLGLDASTTRLPAKLATRFQCPIMMVFIRRDRTEWVAWVEREIRPDPADGAREEQERRILKEMNDCYSDVIRRYPEDWFWIHRRWKTRPGDREAGILR